MKTKVLVSAFAATLLGLSSAAFAQSIGTRGIAGGTAGQDNAGANEAPATGVNGANSNSATVGSTAVTGPGRDADRYDRRHGASRGSSTDNSYEPQRPSMSNDKTDPQHPNVRSADPNR